MSNWKDPTIGWFALPATLEIDDEQLLESERLRLVAKGYQVSVTKILRIVADEDPDTGDIRQVGTFKIGYLMVERKGRVL